MRNSLKTFCIICTLVLAYNVCNLKVYGSTPIAQSMGGLTAFKEDYDVTKSLDDRQVELDRRKAWLNWYDESDHAPRWYDSLLGRLAFIPGTEKCKERLDSYKQCGEGCRKLREEEAEVKDLERTKKGAERLGRKARLINDQIKDVPILVLNISLDEVEKYMPVEKEEDPYRLGTRDFLLGGTISIIVVIIGYIGYKAFSKDPEEEYIGDDDDQEEDLYDDEDDDWDDDGDEISEEKEDNQDSYVDEDQADEHSESNQDNEPTEDLEKQDKEAA